MAATTLTPYSPVDRQPAAFAAVGLAALDITNPTTYALVCLLGRNRLAVLPPGQRVVWTGLQNITDLPGWLAIVPIVQTNAIPLAVLGAATDKVTITEYTSASDAIPSGYTPGTWQTTTPATIDLLARRSLMPDVLRDFLANTSIALRNCGAVADGVTDPNCAITSGAAALSSTSSPGPFSAAMVGRSVIVMGAGTSGADFYATISAFTDAQHVTLSANAATTVSGQRCFVEVTDDYPVFSSAISFLSAVSGGVLRLGPGVYFMDYATAAAIATFTGAGNGLVIQGSGKGNTWIVPSGNTGPQGGVEWLNIAAGNSGEVYDLTVLAPPWQTSVYTSKAIEHAGTAGYVHIERCNFWGFATGIQLDAATNLDAWIAACDLSASPVLDFGGACVSVSEIGGRLRITNCDIHDFGVSGSNQDHGFYIHQAVEYELRGCKWYNQRGTGLCVHNFNGTGTSPAASIEQCDFLSTTVNGILTNPTTRTRIKNCNILSSQYAIKTQNDADISDCLISGFGAAYYGIVQASATPASRVDVRNTKIVPAAATNNCYEVFISGSVWTFTGCELGSNQSAAGVISAGGAIERGCTYADSGGTHDLLVVRGITTPTLSGVNAGITNTSITGDDEKGIVQFDVTASPPGTDSNLLTVNFTTAYPTAPLVLVTCQTGNKSTMTFAVTVTTTGFSIFNCNSLTASSTGWKCGYKVYGL